VIRCRAIYAILIVMDLSASNWQGRLVRLRAIEPEDWQVYFAWNHDDQQARAVSNIPFPQSTAAVREWVEREARRPPDNDAFRFIIVNEDDDVVGDLTTHYCDRRAGTFSYGITIRRDQRRKGYAADAIGLVLRYYFRELRYQKVTVSVASFNEASLRLYERLGFRQEGRIRRTVFTGGAYFD
jgi:RimJ/RimL family protein N-acetyltransferase